MPLPDLFQEIVDNDNNRKNLMSQRVVDIKEYISLRERRKELHKAADSLYGYRLGSDDNTRRS